MSQQQAEYVTVHIGDVSNFNIPAAGITLAQRKRDLDHMIDDALVMCEMYECLAEDFEGIGQVIAAESCHKRAAEWRAKAR